jgi:DMSO/TMAO reductase YedYZ molybdopterin-dependent catalytic subunit
MKSRREFIRILSRFIISLVGVLGVAAKKAGNVYADIKKRILSRETDPGMLASENPEYLDTRNLKISPLEKFGTMGDTDQAIDREAWRLGVTGIVENPLEITYAELLKLPAIHKNVLLVCPGFFSYHAEWTGVSIQALMKKAGVSKTAEKVIIHGQSTHGEKTELFPLSKIKTDEVFLAYAVNGQVLPQKHGFPLRAVAEGHWGSEWIKYVTHLKFE